MIFADKLIDLRKKNGWSQEELAEQMNVTRQSVSKWEGAQSVPDLEKIIKLSNLFGVSTDYLLKDEIEMQQEVKTETISLEKDESSPLRRVSLEEANSYLEAKVQSAKQVALGVFLCIVSPVLLILASGFAENTQSYNVGMGAGLVALFVLVAIAVGIFINNESKMHRFKYLEEEPFETEYGVSGMVKELKNNYKDTYTRSNIIGTILCILSAVPLLCVGIMSDTLDLVVIAEEVSMSDDLLIKMTAIMLIIVAVAVVFFVKSGTIWGSYQRLLQEGEFTVKKQK